MKRFLFALGLAALLAHPVSTQDWHKVSKDFFYSHILLLKSSDGFCTTFAVEKNEFLTAAHCVINDETQKVDKTVSLFDQFHQEFQGKVQVADPSVDLALVESIVGHKKPVKLAKDRATLGTPTLALGFFTSDMSLVVIAGHIAGYSPDGSLLANSPAYQKGMSGGPLINPSEDVVGVNVAIMNPMLGLSVPVETVRKFLVLNKWGK